MQRGYAFRLIPTKEQEQYFWKADGAARFIYNWALDEQKRIKAEYDISLSGYAMCKLLTQLKKEPEYTWLNEIHNKVLKKAVLDCDEAFQRMYKGQNKFPKYKSKKTTIPSFYVETSIAYRGVEFTEDGNLVNKCYAQIKFFHNNTVQLSGIGRVRMSNKAKAYNLWYLTENNIPVCNGRIKYDGEHWNLSFSLDILQKKSELTNEIIGIDLGIKDTAICSNGEAYKNIGDRIQILWRHRMAEDNKIDVHEMCLSYRQSLNKKEQIKIISQLNLVDCSRAAELIYNYIRENNLERSFYIHDIDILKEYIKKDTNDLKEA